MKFKVGDKVTGTNSTQWAWKKIYTIGSVTNGRYRFDTPGDDYSTWLEKELKFANESWKARY